MKKLLLLMMLLSSMMVSGCVRHHYDEPGYSRGGPPPHAPAHGYRHKHSNDDLVFDSGLGVYVVLGRPDYYFWDNRYFRYRDGYWQHAVDLDGRWYRDDGYVPRKLYQSKGDGPGKGGQGKKPGKDKGQGNGNKGRSNSERY
ncbi:MAG: hypothetical protein R3341_06925 [Methylophaga sp.]|nr:hypothetical protein [Methylophaga sp.]